jgi:DNA modification methylase
VTYYTDDQVTLYHGDALDVARELPSGAADCIVTSPPYYSLRDYGIEGQYGLEASPAEYVETMRALFAELRRVLADDGTLWLNLGDSYSAGGNGGNSPEKNHNRVINERKTTPGFAPKNLLGIPWRVAFTLQDDGWILRNAIIWSKPNAMPESVTDRLSGRYEHVFMFSKATWRGDAHLKMPDVDAAWLAALIDGEGTITISRNKRSEKNPAHADIFQVQVSIANTCVPLLDKAARLMGGIEVRLNKGGTNRPIYAVRTSGEKAVAVINAIKPWLIDKAVQADIALSLHDTQRAAGTPKASYQTAEGRAYKERLWEAMLAANRRDGQDLSWLRKPRRGRHVPNPYWFDLDPIREAPTVRTVKPSDFQKAPHEKHGGPGQRPHGGDRFPHENGRNPGDVWTLPAKPFTGAHFAAFPPELPQRCILAGCKPGGTVLDPFSGSGTTGLAAQRAGRRYVGIDLNAEYLELSLNTRLREMPIDFEEPA